MNVIVRRLKKSLSMLLSLLMLISMVSIGIVASANDVKAENVTKIVSGETYMFVMEGITPVNMSSGAYSLKNTFLDNESGYLDFQAFDENSVDDTLLWVVTAVEGGYTMSPAGDENSYLNISSSGLSISGTKQTLLFTWSSSTVTIKNGDYYLRFTNSAVIGGVKQSAFVSGTSSSSAKFTVYKIEDTEPEEKYVYSYESIGGLSDIEENQEYIFAMSGITDANDVSGTFSLMNTSPLNTDNLLNYEAFDAVNNSDSVTDSIVWVIGVEDEGYTMSPTDRRDMYLNITSNGIIISAEKQTLTFTWTSSSIRISANGRYVRFTNSATVNGVSSQSAFTSGTNTASSTFSVYKKVATSVDIDEYEYNRVSAIVSGSDYVLAGVNGTYVITSTVLSEGEALGYRSYSETAITDDSIWTINAEEDGYTISPAGQTGIYLNVTSKGLEFGEKQILTLTWNGNSLQITRDIDGTTYYVRYTNSSSVGNGYVSGTKTASSTFAVYEKQKREELPELDPPTEDPFFTLAVVSDLHIDYGIQNWDVPIRPGTLKTFEYIKSQNVNGIALLGDITSNNARLGWTEEQYAKTMSALKEQTDEAVGEGRTLYVTGNHDFVAGGTNYNSGDYRPFMGEMYEHILYQGSTPEHVLGYHYIIDGVDIVGINTPYEGDDKHNDYYYYTVSTEWLDWVLDEIGEDKTVIVIGHYPLNDSKNISSTSKGMSSTYDTNELFKTALTNHPNAIYLYGHDHGGWKYKTDTYERITTYDSTGNIISKKTYEPSGFVTSFVGSMAYYDGSLGADDYKAVQNLMLYFYSDRIVFQIVNQSEPATGGTQELASYTILRDLSAYTAEPEDEELDDAVVNQNFSFTVETPANATNIYLRNELGRIISTRGLTSERQGSKKIWTVTTSMGTTGENREITVLYRLPNGQRITLGKKYIVTILPVESAISEMKFLSDEVVVGERVQLQVTTVADVSSVNIFNEKGTKMGIKKMSKTVSDGQYIWNMELEIGTAGMDRVFTAVAIGQSGNALSVTKSCTINVVKPNSPVEIIDMEFLNDEVEVNTPVQIKISTTKTVSSIKIVNSKGMKISSSVISKNIIDGGYEWIISIKIGTSGLGRVFTAIPIDSAGVESNATASDTIDVISSLIAA